MRQSSKPALKPNSYYSKWTDIRSDKSGTASVSSFPMAVIIVVVALALLPVVLDFVSDSDLQANLSATQITLLNLIPTFYVIGLVMGLIVWLAISRR